jgi:hypothetical protein
MLGNKVVKRLEVPPAYRRQAVKGFQRTHLPFGSFFCNCKVLFDPIRLAGAIKGLSEGDQSSRIDAEDSP